MPDSIRHPSWRALASRQAVPGSGSYCGGLRFATTSRSVSAWGRRRRTRYAPFGLFAQTATASQLRSSLRSPAPRPSRFAATEIASAGYRPPRRESGGIPTGACQHGLGKVACGWAVSRKTTHRRFAGAAGRIIARHSPPARGFAREVQACETAQPTRTRFCPRGRRVKRTARKPTLVQGQPLHSPGTFPTSSRKLSKGTMLPIASMRGPSKFSRPNIIAFIGPYSPAPISRQRGVSAHMR
ncbi:MAG: hypothetical protein K0Q43_2461 [Ramlibacter sp.]|nr:hypothetical protein [Ramlibacter sp.]